MSHRAGSHVTVRHRAQVLEQPGRIGGHPLELRDVETSASRAPARSPSGSQRVESVAPTCSSWRATCRRAGCRSCPVTRWSGGSAVSGQDVDRWNVGDRVGVAWLAESCGVCEHCRAGRENLCPAAEFTGWDRDGGYAESIVARADFAFTIPDAFSDTEAAPLLCGGVIGYRSLKISGIRPGGRLGLYGFGASALLALQVAVHWGCEVYVATRSAPERERALAFGAVWAGGYDDAPPAELDAAVTFAPVGSVVVAALRAIAPGATVAINAIHLGRDPRLRLRPAVARTGASQRCQLHPPRRREVPRARRRDPHPHRRRCVPARRRESRARTVGRR
jgi:NADPH:quinone reductase-like Zn-dependent oxidoreductase